MQTIQDLFQFVLGQDRTLVFGNLGRYPNRIFEALASIPLLRVIIVSKRCAFASTDNRILVLRPTDPVERCDLLVFLEPATLQAVGKHPLATRVVVFASHYTFLESKGERWINVCYFHEADPIETAALIALQDFPIQTENVGLVEVGHSNVLKISGRSTAAPRQKSTFAIVDLTRQNQDTLSMYLAFWDAFDYLLEYRDFIDRWVVCFSDKGHQSFARFTQKVIDALFCRKFEHGNVTDLREIVSLLPFYTSGTVDKTFHLGKSSFGGMQFVAPKTIEDACKAAAMHDVLHLAKNVLWIYN